MKSIIIAATFAIAGLAGCNPVPHVIDIRDPAPIVCPNNLRTNGVTDECPPTPPSTTTTTDPNATTTTTIPRPLCGN